MTNEKYDCIKVPDDFETLEEAVSHIAEGGTIILSPGLYEVEETLHIEKKMTIKSSTGKATDVKIYGLDVCTIILTAPTARFEGLSIHNEGDEENIFVYFGKPEFFDCDFHSDEKSGMAVRGKDSCPHVVRCTSHDNGDGGTFIDEQGSGLFEDCQYYGNALSNFDLEEEADPVVKRCKMYDGMLNGICVHDGGRGTFEECKIYGNSAAGICILSGSNTLLQQCKIYKGDAEGIFVTNAKLVMENCSIHHNAQIAMNVKEGDLTVRDCHFHNNPFVGVLLASQSKASFDDCIFNNNNENNISLDNSGECHFNRCKIYRSKKVGLILYNQSQASLSQCEFYENAVAAIGIHKSNLSMTDCYIHHEAILLGMLDKCTITENNCRSEEIKVVRQDIADVEFFQWTVTELYDENPDSKNEENEENEEDEEDVQPFTNDFGTTDKHG